MVQCAHITNEPLPKQNIDYFIFILRCNDVHQIKTEAEVRKLIDEAPATSHGLELPMEEIEIAVLYGDGGSEGIKHTDKRRLHAWLDRVLS